MALLEDRAGDAPGSWSALATPGLLAALALLLGAIATAKLTLLAVWLPGGVEWVAGCLALLCFGSVVLASSHTVRWPAATLAVTGAVLAGLALGRLAREEPMGVGVLFGALLLMSALVGLRILAWSAAGILAGATLAFVVLAGMPDGASSLSVEPTYRGVAIAPVWMAVDRSLLAAAAALVGGCLLVLLHARRSGGGEEMQRYRALERLMRGKGGSTAEHYAAVVAALADRRWSLIGAAFVEAGMVRVVAARGPADRALWSMFARALRDGAVPLQNAENPLACAARRAKVVAMQSCEELIVGMLRSFTREEHHAASSLRQGYAVPFGSVARRGVLFAIGDETHFPAKEWLLDLAGVLTLMELQPPEGGGDPS